MGMDAGSSVLAADWVLVVLVVVIAFPLSARSAGRIPSICLIARQRM
jgi:hypothetical protein